MVTVLNSAASEAINDLTVLVNIIERIFLKWKPYLRERERWRERWREVELVEYAKDITYSDCEREGEYSCLCAVDQWLELF